MMEQTEKARLHANEDSYDRLIGVIEASQGMLNLLIVSCEQSSFQTQVIERYETELSSQFPCYRVKLDPEEPSLRSSLAQLVQEQPELQQSQVAAVVTVTGIAELLTIKLRETEDKSPLDKFFGYLQWTREGLRVFPFPIVLWMTPEILSRMSLAAPDFWSWRGGVFRFSAPAMEIKKIVNTEFQEDLPHLHFEHSNILPLDELEERISQIQAQDARSPSLATLYDRLGQAYSERIRSGNSKQLEADINQAVTAFQKSITLQKTLKSKVNIGNLLIELGNLYNYLGQYQSAKSFYEEALEIFENIEDKQGEAGCLGNLGVIYKNLGEYQNSLAFYHKSLEIFREIDNKQGEANALGNLGTVYSFLGDYQQAILFHQKSLEIKIEIRNKQGEANSLGSLGNIYSMQKHYQQGIFFYKKSLEIFRELRNKRGESASLANLGNIYRNIERYQQAITFLQEALAIKREIGDRRGEAQCLDNLGSTYNQLEEFDQGVSFYQQSLEIFKEIKYKHGVANAWWNLGLIFEKCQRYSDSLNAFQNARQLFQEMELNSWVQRCDNEINSLSTA